MIASSIFLGSFIAIAIRSGARLTSAITSFKAASITTGNKSVIITAIFSSNAGSESSNVSIKPGNSSTKVLNTSIKELINVGAAVLSAVAILVSIIGI